MQGLHQQIDEIITKLAHIKSQLPAEEQQLTVTPEITGDNAFKELVTILNSDQWPHAVNPHLICDPSSESAKEERARGILEFMVEENLEGLNFLDFGCGEGDCAFQALGYKAKQSVGFDITSSPRWKNTVPNLVMTTDFSQVTSCGPYDAILIFDVLDHLTNDDPINILSKLKGLLSQTGKIYVRYHPFVSRHALHHYHTLNKAFVHLVFTESELMEIMPEFKILMPGYKVVKPVMTYNDWAAKSELFIVSQRNQTEKVEPFFKAPMIANRIQASTGFGSFPEYQLGIQFSDYTLRSR